MSENKIKKYEKIFRTLINREKLNPYAVDYDEEKRKIYSENPNDKILIAQAENEYFISK